MTAPTTSNEPAPQRAEAERKIVTVDEIRDRNIEAHREPYFNWLRQVATVAGSSLTALIALQGQYIPLHPNWPLCLGAALASLLLSLLCALFALRAEWSVSLDQAATIERLHKIYGEESAANYIRSQRATLPKRSHRFAVESAQILLGLAFLLLSVFAFANFEKIGSMRPAPVEQSAAGHPAR